MALFRLTRHAQEQIDTRGVTTGAEVLGAVNRYADEIENTREWQVKVVVKRLTAKVYLPDGSNGDVVLAAVDPGSGNVKTIMLQRGSQVERKSKDETYLGW